MSQQLHVLIGKSDRESLTPRNRTLVFDDQCTQDLARLNAAARALRQMGYVIEGEQLPLRLEGARTLIQLQRGQNMKPLTDKSKGWFATRMGDHLIVHTEFKGVLVCWREQP